MLLKKYRMMGVRASAVFNFFRSSRLGGCI
jgi:hypothetical protein